MLTGNVRIMNQISGVITGDGSLSGALAKCNVSLERSIIGDFSFPADIPLSLPPAAIINNAGIVLNTGGLSGGRMLLSIPPSALKRIVGRELQYWMELANSPEIRLFVAINSTRKLFPVKYSLLQQGQLILSRSTGTGDPINCNHGGQESSAKHPVARVIPITSKDNSHPVPFSSHRKYHQLALAPEEDAAFCIETNPAYHFTHDLTTPEKRLLQVLSHYRRAIPQTHRVFLEHYLSVPGAWAGLVCQGLIVADSTPWHVRMSEHLRDWFRSCFNPDSPEDRSLDSPIVLPSDQIMPKKTIHAAIASCWLDELLNVQSVPVRQRLQAREALYHLTEAGDSRRIRQIPLHLFSGELSWARKRLRKLYDDLYHQNAPLDQQRQVLEYRAELDPDNDVVHRFLGQCWQKEEGKGSRKAIACFETACRLKPDYPPYWADLGHALLATGSFGAQEFLVRLEKVTKEYPTVINNYVNVVRIACIKAVSGSREASNERSTEIGFGSVNPVFYADEAKDLLKRGNPAQALEVIVKAEQHGCGNDIIAAIKAAALQKLGKKQEAAMLRLEKIVLGSRNPAFFSEEAKARLEAGEPEGALAILDLAVEKDLCNDYIVAIRTTALARVGRATEAAAIRLRKIMANSRNGVFYNDEANARIMAGNFKGAREILELAVKNNCANQITSVLWAKAERMESKLLSEKKLPPFQLFDKAFAPPQDIRLELPYA